MQKGNHKGLQTSPDLEESNEDWTEYQEELARHSAWKLHTELHKTKGAYKRRARDKLVQRPRTLQPKKRQTDLRQHRS